ncbi:MAG: hypothetical protein AAB389_04845 [Patescibacteria group bacterium]
MAPQQNLVKFQLQYASGEFTRFINLVVEYKWWILGGIVLFLLLLRWLWRR